jgi:hypothetical protein
MRPARLWMLGTLTPWQATTVTVKAPLEAGLKPRAG